LSLTARFACRTSASLTDFTEVAFVDLCRERCVLMRQVMERGRGMEKPFSTDTLPTRQVPMRTDTAALPDESGHDTTADTAAQDPVKLAALRMMQRMVECYASPRGRA
jgi:hypothetical protein